MTIRDSPLLRGDRRAFGAPGLPPRWTHSNKEGIGTAYSADSRLWFTLWRGSVSEVYGPTIDLPQVRDLGFLITDGETFFHEEKRHLEHTVTRPYLHALGYRVESRDPAGRYHLEKRILGDPHLPVLLTQLRLFVHDPQLRAKIRVYALAAPHLMGGGSDNNGAVLNVLDRPLLAAEKPGAGLALGTPGGWRAASVGYVGASDGWTDLAGNYRLDWEFDQAPHGNIALVGELPLRPGEPITIGLAVAQSVSAAITALYQSLGTGFAQHEERFVEQWDRTVAHTVPLARASHDEGRLCRSSRSVLLAHEDKTFPGAFIASLSIPWGAWKGDDDRGGYHLVWTRDMVQTSSALLASGHSEGALRALVYLATRQHPDGGFPQNFWLSGRPYWNGVQLDEVAFPVLLAHRLAQDHQLGEFDPIPMVRRAARFLIHEGPVTQQERWEELSGFSPSTLAATIAALTAAADLLRGARESTSADFAQRYADFLEGHLDGWTVTDRGTAIPGRGRHYVRIRPARPDDPTPNEGPDMGWVTLPNLAPSTPNRFPAESIVDPGFLELVRYGIRRADDPTIEASVEAVDAQLKVETPFGPTWRRYNHDGYGDRGDGGPYEGWGVGRAWPLLTGERGHYELARGRDPSPYLATLERMATRTGLLPEQVWDQTDRPDFHMFLGEPTEGAMPLCWAHAEYLKLLRSVTDRRVFDRIDSVEARYAGARRRPPPLEVWKFNRQPATIGAGVPLRIIADQPFVLHWSDSDWSRVADTEAAPTPLGLHYVDLPPLGRPDRRYRFTFRWSAVDRWEGRDFALRSV
ncbi:MAG: glycoside hydrolase family 15 protein [Thermoplasmata archaeon]